MSARETATARRMRLAAGVYMAIRKQRTTMQARARQQLEQHMLDGQQQALDAAIVMSASAAKDKARAWGGGEARARGAGVGLGVGGDGIPSPSIHLVASARMDARLPCLLRSATHLGGPFQGRRGIAARRTRRQRAACRVFLNGLERFVA